MSFYKTPRIEQLAPAGTHATITPGASVLDPIPRELYVNGAGDATIVDVDGTSIQYTSLTVGMRLPIKAWKITAATATIVAWY